MKEQGIPTAVHYPIPLNKQPACAHLESDCSVAEKVAEKTEKVTKAAEKAESVKEEETATEITPSKTLMAAYNDLKNKDGKITANTADEFVAAITKDHKYTKNEQATMRILRNAEAFTAAGYREVLLGIRRFIAKTNFAK